jgi:hypothetical protein
MFCETLCFGNQVYKALLTLMHEPVIDERKRKMRLRSGSVRKVKDCFACDRRTTAKEEHFLDTR